jgi:[ribosomal protein S5]-alanine N-acetyltransferase
MELKIFIETPRLVLRQWKASDYEPYIQLNLDSDVMEFFPSVATRDETLAQIDRFIAHIDQYGYGFFAVERKDNGQFIGFTGLSHPRFEASFTPCVEIGWRLRKANWGRGFATEAAKACLEFGFDSIWLDEIYAFTSVHNKRSEQVMIKARMVKQGEFEHPLIQDEHFLKPHLLYKISRPTV